MLSIEKIKNAIRICNDPEEYGKLVEAMGHLVAAQETLKDVTLPAAPSVEWYTPDSCLELVREVLGKIDLDPCSSGGNDGVNASVRYTKGDDGLTMPWYGNVFCNPPYGKGTEKFIRYGMAQPVDSIIYLVNRTGAAWYVDVLPEFTAVCRVRKRVAFIDGSTGEIAKSPRYYNDFLYSGPNADQFVKTFSTIGMCNRYHDFL